MLKRKLNKQATLIIILLISAYNMLAGFEPFDKTGYSSNLTNDSLSKTFVSDSSVLTLDDDIQMVEIPEVPLHPTMGVFIEDYSGSHDDLFEKIKQTKSNYFKTIDKIFTEYKIPIEMKYMAVVESKMKTNATSGVGAVGLWQFMPATAKMYGLKITSKYDERQHLWKSTVAAAKYLETLYGYFEDWLLVVAAYNGGPGTVFNAIKKSGSRNFWKLQYFLPKETRLHVKRFIATHYYFEGKGSLVTLGKSESDKYLSELEEFMSTANADEEGDELPDTTPEEVNNTQWVAVVNNENALQLLLKK